MKVIFYEMDFVIRFKIDKWVESVLSITYSEMQHYTFDDFYHKSIKLAMTRNGKFTISNSKLSLLSFIFVETIPLIID